MKNYSPPYQISNEILLEVASISEKIGQIAMQQMSEKKLYLRKSNKIRSIHSSLRIEANSLSLDEVADVIEGRLVQGPQREIQEVKNAYDAYKEIQTLNPFDLQELKRLHGIITRYLVNDSGKFRSGEEGVFNGDKCIFMAPPARLVNELMQDLFMWMDCNRNVVHPLIMAAVFHYEFVFIHPFSDGNGRMARLWHTTILAKWHPVFEFIPIETQIEKYQTKYYQVIADCHIEGNSNQFILFMLQQINNAIDSLLWLEKKTSLSERILECIAENRQITRQQMADRIGVSQSTITRELRKMPNVYYVGSAKSGYWEVKSN